MVDINNLSVCIIAKNEGENIKSCINSVKSADEIIVVDTGSDDDTVLNAKNMGAKVIEIKWNDDFSYARNISIENATKKWILILDCDEIIENIDSIYSIVNSQHENSGYYLKLKNILNGKVVQTAAVFRLFKNNKKYRFKGKIHEQIISSIKEIEGENFKSSVCTAEIIHNGYDKEFTNIKKKSERNFKILFNYEESQKDSYYYYVLGNEYGRINNNNEAIVNYEKSEKLISDDEESTFYPYLVSNIIKVLYKENRHEECIRKINIYINFFPDLRELYFVKFLCNLDMLQIEQAIQNLELYLSIEKQNEKYPETIYVGKEEGKEMLKKLKFYNNGGLL